MTLRHLMQRGKALKLPQASRPSRRANRTPPPISYISSRASTLHCMPITTHAAIAPVRKASGAEPLRYPSLLDLRVSIACNE
jgi:hypothetical protein